MGQGPGDRLDLRCRCQHPFNLRRERGQFRQRLADLVRCQRPQRLTQLECHQVQGSHLCDEGLRRRHADFGARTRVENPISQTGSHGTDDIRYGQNAKAHFAHHSLSGDSIGCFTRLGDDDEKCIRIHRRASIPELAGIVDLNRHMRYGLDHILTSKAGVPTRAATEKANALEALPVLFRKPHVVEAHFVRLQRKPSHQRLADGFRLLVDFLQHKVLVAPLLGLHGVPGNTFEMGLTLRSGKVHQADPVGFDDSQFTIIQEQQVTGVRKQGRNVGSNEAFPASAPDDSGRPIATGHNFLWVVG